MNRPRYQKRTDGEVAIVDAKRRGVVSPDLEAVGRLGRDDGRYSARNSSKGSLIAETHAILGGLNAEKSIRELRAECLEGRLLRQFARETRRQIWDAIHWRLFAWNPPAWVIGDLVRASEQGPTSSDFVGLVFLHYARRDRLTFDFVTRVLWELRDKGPADVRRNDVLDFLAQVEDDGAVRWRESTRKKLAGNLLSALRDFGLLAGVQRKRLQRPLVSVDVVLHLCRLLQDEGLRGRSVLEAPDWRLFFWDIQATSQALSQLAQRGDIRFERSGRSVVLELCEHSVGEGL